MTINYSTQDNIAIISFNDPPNEFISIKLVEQASQALEKARLDDNVKSVIFTGASSSVFLNCFSPEEVLKMSDALKEHRKSGLAEPRFAQTPLRKFWEDIDNFCKPTIAAINGMCVGAGFELALACDIRIASDGDYYIGQTDIQMGLSPSAGASGRLVRLVGTGKALEWLLRGRTFSPKEALQEGIVNHIAKESALSLATSICIEFGNRPGPALAAIKQLVKSAQGRTTKDIVDMEGDLFANLLANDKNAIAAVKHFISNQYKFVKI
ncbi:MAG: enoyl-CoA hydratase/isomerase family protein [Pseudomonadota bacterium]|nr:enoyl-CoA hydratase/isomerase family protein [Pseudomonadota bacterium]